jgi:hypothetical protein
MKFDDILRGFLPLTDETIKSIWDVGDFIFDTNVLLNIYRYSKASREAFFRMLDALKGRTFVPHRVAVEFARNRRKVIREHYEPHYKLIAHLDEATKKILGNYKKHPQHSDLVRFIAHTVNNLKQSFGDSEKAHLQLITNDILLTRLRSIIGPDAGEPFPAEPATAEYKRRKDGSIPPFCKDDDSKSGDRGMGDVLIWLEIKAKYQGTQKPLVFVTGDQKENWWQDAGGGQSIPQPALIQEMYETSGNDIQFYTVDKFVDSASNRLGITLPDTLSEETKTIRDEAKKREIEALRAAHAIRKREAEIQKEWFGNEARHREAIAETKPLSPSEYESFYSRQLAQAEADYKSAMERYETIWRMQKPTEPGQNVQFK